MELPELVDRAEKLASDETSSNEARALIDAAIAWCEASGEPCAWECRQISHAIVMASWGLWRAVGAALSLAFGPKPRPVIAGYPIVTIVDLKFARAGLDFNALRATPSS